MCQFVFHKNVNAIIKTKRSSSSPSDNKNKLCRRGQGVKRKLKHVVFCLEYKSKYSCLQAFKSCSNSYGCIGCESPFGENREEDPQVASSVKQLINKHSLTTEIVLHSFTDRA